LLSTNHDIHSAKLAGRARLIVTDDYAFIGAATARLARKRFMLSDQRPRFWGAIAACASITKAPAVIKPGYTK